MSTDNTTSPNMQCEQDVIATIGADFFEKIFEMDIDEVLLTDISELSDFSFSGAYHFDAQDPSLTLNQAYRQWDAWVLGRIQEEYGLALTSTRISLISLFAQLEAIASPVPYLH